MQKIFFEYKKPNEEFFQTLWKECIFVLDTNVLLNFYRYSDSTYQQLQDVLIFFENRIWLPHQVGEEFFKNRLNVIEEQKNNYAEAVRNINKLKTTLLSRKGHPFISSNLLLKFEETIKEVENEFNEQQIALTNLVQNDKVLDLIFNIFKDKAGEPFVKTELVKLYTEASERFKNNIPPGFKDHKKTEPERYNDFILWKQIINQAKLVKKSVIFISDDEKEDWVLINSNKVLGPLPKLIKEFKEETSKDFYLYQTFNFLKYAYSIQQKEINQPAIDEAKEVGATSLNTSVNRFSSYFIKVLLDINKCDRTNLDIILNTVSSQGYDLDIKEINFNSGVFEVSLTVPFEDLVRRFHRILSMSLESSEIRIISFNSAVLNE